MLLRHIFFFSLSLLFLLLHVSYTHIFPPNHSGPLFSFFFFFFLFSSAFFLNISLLSSAQKLIPPKVSCQDQPNSLDPSLPSSTDFIFAPKWITDLSFLACQ
ncbi:hypothetical protein K457DRAFT_214254 [Linnemannia elongata AG-77]|uniref:Uncharacterized protein n=1 Tax=Linnemannia elongata AG-77 TaxID=1314771 RepID=A0A197K6M8_9FUNG|nr:hypothetical protein K457DRAFT_214254 [Linnemannia elongata AG-77]